MLLKEYFKLNSKLTQEYLNWLIMFKITIKIICIKKKSQHKKGKALSCEYVINMLPWKGNEKHYSSPQ